MNLIARIILPLFASLILTAVQTNAAIRTVTKTADTNDSVCDADCSLREAIFAAAASGDEIQFASPLFDAPQTINLSSTNLLISKSLTITGKGAHLLTVRRSPSATSNFGILSVSVLGQVNLSGMTITGGNATSFGGISIAGGANVTITNCLITGNSSLGVGGISIGASQLNLINSTVSNNTSGISSGQTAGAIATHASTLNIINSTISGNSVTGGGSANGGAIRNSGSGSVNITHSTITNNSTVGLSSTNAGGIANLLGTVTIRNSVVAGNTGTVPDVYGDIDGLYVSEGYNLIGKNDGAATYFAVGNPNANNDIVGTSASPVDPLLDPLGLYGGTTPTHRLQTSPVSPAIDRGSDLGGLTTDQRGLTRPYDNPLIANAGGANANGSDIGAFEVQAVVTPPVSNLQFDTASYSVNEGAGYATITVIRTADTSATVTVDFETGDLGAEQRTDYTITAGTLTFAPGETSKTFPVLIVDDVYVDGSEVLNLTLSNATGGGVLGSPSSATLTITDNDSISPTTNPLDTARFFAQQHFYDFLSRYPDPGGWDFWTSQVTQCGADPICLRTKRIDVSNAFFYELEYQQTGAYTFRLYRAAFGNNQPFPNPDNSNQTEAKKLPGYDVFARDRARVVGGMDLAGGQQSLANAFAQRPQFLAKYPLSQDGPTFVDAVLATIKDELGADLTSQRTALISLFNSGGRGVVLYRLADDNILTNPINNRAFIDAEYNRAFVATQYFGYLRRDSDIGGFLFWLGQVNSAPLRDITKQHAMVCAFITSAEYQQRFSSVVTHTNAECP